MDNLTYNYNLDANGQLLNNKLTSVNDAVPAVNYPNDIDNESANNYGYDAIGNMTSDAAGGITSITWTVYGKISSITKTDGSSISYSYDAAGNRISKTVTPASGTATTTWYVRDASGNTMAVYTATGSDSLHQTEQDLYGSSRLGLFNRNINADAALPTGTPANLIGNYFTSNFTRGNKLFEGVNHLGNVLVTFTDKKIQHSTDGNTIDYYSADVASAQDFYPFGMLMPGRNYSVANTNYRYGFNGKENDNDIENGAYDFSSRILDTRLGGRWFSIDPQQRKYPNESNYIFTSDNPIIYADADGKDKIYTLTVIDRDGHKVVTHHTDASFGIYSVSERAGIFNPNHYFESDLNVNLTIDLRSKTATYYQFESNFRQISAGDYRIDKILGGLKSGFTRIYNSFKPNDNERGSQRWGIPFMSEYSHTADGSKTDPTEGTDRSVNIDGIMAAAGAVKMSPEALKFTMENLPEWAELLHNDAEVLTDLQEKKEQYNNSSTSVSPTNSSANTKSNNNKGWQIPKTLPDNDNNSKLPIKYKHGYMQSYGNWPAGTVLNDGPFGNVRVNPDSTATDCQDCQATDTVPTEKKKK